MSDDDIIIERLFEENKELKQQLAQAKRGNLRQRVRDAIRWIDYEKHLGSAIISVVGLDNGRVDELISILYKDRDIDTVMDWLIEQGVEG